MSLHVSAFHCIYQHFWAFFYISLHSSAFLCISLHSSAFFCISLHSAVFNCIFLRVSACLCILLHSARCISLHFTFHISWQFDGAYRRPIGAIFFLQQQQTNKQQQETLKSLRLTQLAAPSYSPVTVSHLHQMSQVPSFYYFAKCFFDSILLLDEPGFRSVQDSLERCKGICHRIEDDLFYLKINLIAHFDFWLFLGCNHKIGYSQF